MKKTYIIRWSEIEQGCETETDPYDGLPCAVPTADWDEATATLYEATGDDEWDDDEWEEIDSETARFYTEEEEETETKWKQCEHTLAERNGVREYKVSWPY